MQENFGGKILGEFVELQAICQSVFAKFYYLSHELPGVLSLCHHIT